MHDELLPTLDELVDYGKKMWGTEYATKEERFKDAFQNGEFHNESSSLYWLTADISIHSLVRMYLPICRALLVSEITCDDEAAFEKILNLYLALGNWQRGLLSTVDELLSSLDLVRPLVFKLSPGWAHLRLDYSLLDCGIRSRMGLRIYELADKYEKEIYPAR